MRKLIRVVAVLAIKKFQNSFTPRGLKMLFVATAIELTIRPVTNVNRLLYPSGVG